MDLKFTILTMKQARKKNEEIDNNKLHTRRVFIADAIPRKCKTENHFQLLKRK